MTVAYRVFVLVIVVLMSGAAITAACGRRWLDVLYWASAAALNVSVLLR